MLYDGDSAGRERFLGHIVLSARSLCSLGQISPLEVNIVLLQTRKQEMEETMGGGEAPVGSPWH